MPETDQTIKPQKPTRLMVLQCIFLILSFFSLIWIFLKAESEFLLLFYDLNPLILYYFFFTFLVIFLALFLYNKIALLIASVTSLVTAILSLPLFLFLLLLLYESIRCEFFYNPPPGTISNISGVSFCFVIPSPIYFISWSLITAVLLALNIYSFFTILSVQRIKNTKYLIN